VSSSPSNSPTQPGAEFPTITIRDMVRHQHRFLTEVMGIRHLKAVTGVSMGGMQTFEWAVAYPDFSEKALPIVGSPRLATYDIVLWETYLRILEWSIDCDCQAPAAVIQGLWVLISGPDYQARTSPRTNLEEVRRGFDSAVISNDRAWDLSSQLKAMISHDVSGPHGSSLENAAARVKADFLVVVGLTDHVVTPGPALAFADLLGAETLALANDCGHSAYSCAPAAFRPRVAAFLKR
jgi:homoserine O-acetyltransferase